MTCSKCCENLCEKTPNSYKKLIIDFKTTLKNKKLELSIHWQSFDTSFIHTLHTSSPLFSNCEIVTVFSVYTFFSVGS